MPKTLDSLLASIQKSNTVKDRAAAIRIAKSRGWIKQDGSSLALTTKGRSVASNS